MRKFSVGLVFSLVAVMAFTFTALDAGAADTIKLGFNIPLTGDNPDVGASSKNGAEMYLKKNPKITVGGKSYALKFVYDDNEYKAESAVKVSTKLITEEGVLGIIGPQSSSQAVPAGEVANNMMTPMISLWSTNPNTTLDRPFVFRGCFLDPFQGPVLADDVDRAGLDLVHHAVLEPHPPCRGLAEVQHLQRVLHRDHAAQPVVGRAKVIALDQLELDEDLRWEVDQARRITSMNARRREERGLPLVGTRFEIGARIE